MAIHARTSPEPYQVAEPCSVEVFLESDHPLVVGDCIQIQFPNSWSLVTGPSYTRAFQSSDPEAAHFVSVTATSGVQAEFELSIQPRHLNFPEGKGRHGRLIAAKLVEGGIPAGTPIRIGYQNTLAPYVSETESLWIRVNQEAPEHPPVLRTEPGPHAYFRVIVPSCARPGESFDVLVVSLDRFDNRSSSTFHGERLALSDGRVIAEDLDFAGSVRVPVSIAQHGVYRVRFRDLLSNAIKIDEHKRGPYWGDLHIHTKLSSDAQGTAPYAYARQVSGLDFAAVTDHWESLGPEGYRIVKQWDAEANVPGVFVTIPADERNPRELMGHHNVYFRGLEAMARHQALYVQGQDPPANSFGHLLDANASEVMVVPHHTGINFGDLRPSSISNAIYWNAVDDRGLRPVMEIYSHHGQSESYNPQHLLAYEWNRMRNPERRANTSAPGPFYAQNYWMQGARVGVIASSDEHSGQGGRRHGGIAAVFASSLTRDGIFEALLHRRCYATTGERILVEFTVDDDLAMGARGTRERGSQIAVGLKVWGTDTLLRVEILRHRFGLDQRFIPIVSMSPRPESTDVAIVHQERVEASCMFYARVTQEPLAWPGMAWSSPIWVAVD